MRPILPTPAPIRLQRTELKHEQCRAGFDAYLEQHRTKKTFLGPGGLLARDAARTIESWCRQNMPHQFLGVTLGGPVTHGLGLDFTSPLACHIYLREIDSRALSSLTAKTTAYLRSKRFEPGKYLICNLGERPFKNPAVVLWLVTGLPVGQEINTPLAEAALLAAKDAVSRLESSLHQPLLAALRREYLKLSGCDPADLVDQYLRRLEPGPFFLGTSTLRNDPKFKAELIAQAQAPLADRAKRFPFPAVIEAIFRK